MTRAAIEQVLERLLANPVLPSFALMHEIGHPQLRLWRQIGGARCSSAGHVEDTEPVKRRQRRPTLASIHKQATKAGIPVSGYELRPDGSIGVVVTPTSATTNPDGTKPVDRSEWH